MNVCVRATPRFLPAGITLRVHKALVPCTGSGWIDLSAHSVCRRRRVHQL